MADNTAAEDLLRELAELRRRVAELESAETERSHTEETLRERHEELQAIYDAMVDGLLVAEVESKQFLRCNAAMSRMTGYSEEELLSMSVMELHPPADLPHVLERFQAQAEGRLSVNDECPVLRKDGTVFYADISVGRITYRGQPCMIGFFRDISQRKQAEASLRQSEEKYRILVEASPDAVIMADLEGRITYASQRAVQLYGGRSAAELCCRLAIDLVAQEDRPRFQANLARLLEEGIQRGIEYSVLRRDGTRIACEVSSALFLDAAGNPSDLVAIVRDISARKASEEALRQSHQELQAIYDGTPDGLMIVDIQTLQRVRTNARMCQMLGYSQDDLPAHPESVHPPEALPAIIEKFHAQAQGHLPLAENIPFLRRDGSIFYADITGNRIEYNGRPCVLSFVRDVTERKQAHEALERERHTLQHMLRASDHERQLIAYEIHDGLAQELAAAMMQFQTYEHLKEHQPANAQTAYDAGVQMLRQAHFETRRLISGVRPPILDESGITAAIAHLVHDHNQERCPEVEFVARVSFDRLPKVLENTIYRIAQESLTNACKHSRSEKIRVSLVQEGRRVRLEIQDWGVGFDPGTVAGDRFGLKGIRERARLLGGTTAIESVPGHGTLIRTVLPLVEPEQPQPA